MNKFVLYLLVFTLLMFSCKKDVGNEKRTYEYFKANLTAGMDYTTIKTFFSEPDTEMGSGIRVYVYKLNDSTQIWIGYTDHIMYARHVDASGQVLLHTIL